MSDHELIISRAEFGAVILNLDGVVTRINKAHAAAWKQIFDAYLIEHNALAGEDLRPFHIDLDFNRYMDGRPRDAGIRHFLSSRHIELPMGTPEDPPDRLTVYGLGNRKSMIFDEFIETQGIEVYGCAIAFIRQLRNAGIKTAVVSASKHCDLILKQAEIQELFDARIDGTEAERLELDGRPDPYVMLELTRRLGIEPEKTVAIEDSVVGVTAGKRGHFGLIIGIDDGQQREPMLEHGADHVLQDLCSVHVDGTAIDDDISPPVLTDLKLISNKVKGKHPVLFLDYGGTLTSAAFWPEDVRISKKIRRILQKVARLMPVTIVSGHDVEDVCMEVGLKELYYAGNHGLEICGPGMHLELPKGVDALGDLDQAMKALVKQIQEVPGVSIRRNRFAIVVHFGRNDAETEHLVAEAMEKVQASFPRLRITRGKEVFELLPNIDWDKGRAVEWLLSELDLNGPDDLPVYVGDDVTDEAVFKVIHGHGIGILVTDRSQPSAATYRLQDPDEVLELLKHLIQSVSGKKFKT